MLWDFHFGVVVIGIILETRSMNRGQNSFVPNCFAIYQLSLIPTLFFLLLDTVVPVSMLVLAVSYIQKNLRLNLLSFI